MLSVNELGTVRISEERPAVKRLTIEAVCDEAISCPQVEETLKKIINQFGGSADCKISRLNDNICVVVSSGQNPVKKTPFEKYLTE